MSTYTAFAAFDDEPTPSELAAIAAEEPVIDAEVAVVDAECALAMSPDEVTIRRVVLRTAVETSTNRATSTAPTFVVGSPFSTARRVAIRPATRTA
jgi:hypothetical protein